MKKEKGSIRDPKIVAKIAMANRGQKRSTEAKQRMRLAKLGTRRSEESKKKTGDALRGKTRPKEFGEKMSKILKGRKVPWVTGSNHWCWKGGITPETKKRINTPEWKEIRSKVYERDNWTCVKCRKHCKDDIQCDHIVPWRITHNDALENLQTLCKSCHMRKDVKLFLNENHACAFTIVDDLSYYPEGTHIFANSFVRYHPDIDLIIFRQDMVDKVFKEKGINFFQAKPYFGEIVANMGYKLVVNIDADTVITGRLSEVFDNVDYDIACPTNLNDYENASLENITEEMYLQAGMVASTSKDFWLAWQKINSTAMQYLRKENDTLNLLVYNDPVISKMKLKILDKEKDYYGCKSLGREGKFSVYEDKLWCGNEQVLAYHHAKGPSFPKLRFESMPFNVDVQNWLQNVGYYGQSVKINVL